MRKEEFIDTERYRYRNIKKKVLWDGGMVKRDGMLCSFYVESGETRRGGEGSRGG